MLCLVDKPSEMRFFSEGKQEEDWIGERRGGEEGLGGGPVTPNMRSYPHFGARASTGIEAHLVILQERI